MAISNYSELQTSIANWMNNDQLGTVIPDFIKLAETRIATDFKTQHIMTQTSITTDAATKALPTNNKGVVSGYLDTDPKTRLDYMTPDEFYSRWAASQTGKPSAYTIIGQNVTFGPSPDSSYSFILTHYATPNLETDDTNSLLTNYATLYLFASLAEGFDYTEDDPGKYERKYLTALSAAQEEEDYYGALAIQLGDAP